MPKPKTNRLAGEKSPYLLQHSHNPVDWYPWGDEAFSKAKTEEKPIFLSIGYSSCHWCHVMERESFEDEGVAKLLNESFICIKVDREERPDVDQIYMKAVQAMTGSGGWPLNLFLTPDLEPFYGGTYFPPISRYGMPGFVALIKNIAGSWKRERFQIVSSASQIRKALSQTLPASNSNIDGIVIEKCFADLAHYFDQEYGGFGNSPKFPTPSNLFFLMRFHLRDRAKAPLLMVLKTLDAMAKGGIYDQVGGGFHRYSTDRIWLVPHFEKMLYDNALLSIAYTEAFLLTGESSYQRIVAETLEWVQREMTSGETGGYFSAQDADSPDGEGSYYVWTKEEIKQALLGKPISGGAAVWNEAEIDLVLSYFGVEDEGNFEGTKTILTAKVLKVLSRGSIITEAELQAMIANAKLALLNVRSKRSRPFTDDKILTSWNGMMISAMARAYEVFRDEKYVESARRAADFVLSKLSLQDDGKAVLKRRYRDGEVKDDGVLEDYAYFGNSLLDLYEATFEPRYLKQARLLCDSMLTQFYDEKSGGFFETRKDTPNLILRPKEAYDGAIPSSNSIAALFCLRMCEITSLAKYKDSARRTFECFWSSVESTPSSHTEMLVALNYYLANPKEIVVSGDLSEPETKVLIAELRSHFLPNSITLHATKELEKDLAILEGRVHSPGQSSRVFVCSNFTCQLPSTTREELVTALES
ncbi:MAG: thioredoxin domain-containing protein [Nitrososphaerales archaeon]